MQLSRLILESPISLFLGAGASQPLGKLTMQPFVAGLPSRIKYRDEKIRTALANFVECCGEDLELILGELDAISQLKSGDFVERMVDGSRRSISKNVVSGVRHAIEYEIIRQYAEVPHRELQDIYRPLFDLIFARLDPKKHCLPIFTTNYDPAIETWCDLKSSEYELTDGFKQVNREYIWDSNVFHNFELKPGKRNIVLFKLHGSVDWLFVQSKNSIIRSQPFHESIDSKRYKNVLIYPAVHKVATDEPYYTAYDYYGRCCEKSRLLLTIGYSFRDYDALARLRSAMFSNPQLRLLLVAPDASDILARLPLDREQVRESQNSFGKDTELYLSDLNELMLSLFVGAV